MLKSILSISGKPGLYKLISSGKNMLIVEAMDETKKRMPAYAYERIISLGDIAMYTDEEDVPLYTIFESMSTKENGQPVAMNPKKVKSDELYAYLGEVLPNFDRDRVHPEDIRKLILWYNILIKNGVTEFKEQEEAEK